MHAAYTLTQMAEITAFACLGTACLAVVLILSAWPALRNRATAAARAGWEAGCASAGCTHVTADDKPGDTWDDDDATAAWVTSLSADPAPAWEGIDAELLRLHAWADRLAAAR